MNNTTMGFITSQTVNEAVQDLATIDWIGIPWLATFDIETKTKDDIQWLIWELFFEFVEFAKILDEENDLDLVLSCIHAKRKLKNVFELLKNYQK